MTADAEFERYVGDSFARLCRTGFLLCGDWQRAEDAVQETLLKMHRSWGRIERHEGLDAYARQTLVRTLIDDWRHPWRQRENVASHLPEAESASSSIDATTQIDDRALLVQAVALLSPRQRACVVLRFYLDASVADTAAALGCSEGNVKRLTSDGLTALRHVLDTTEGSLA
jgi:RNA polymerase sigma-70 factor (sigma-E family)